MTEVYWYQKGLCKDFSIEKDHDGGAGFCKISLRFSGKCSDNGTKDVSMAKSSPRNCVGMVFACCS